MGRKKIPIQPLPESQIRAKFKKRKSGLVKKAYELGTLCGAQVALIIFSKDGEEVIDKAYNGTTLEIIQRYSSEVHRRRGQPQQQIAALQAQQFQPSSDSSTQGIPMDPNMQQAEVAMDPQVQQEQYMNPQVQQEQYMNPQVQHEQYVNPQVQHEQYVNPQVQHEQYVNPPVQQEQYLNPQVQHEQYMNPPVQQEQYMNQQVQQEVPIDPNMQQVLYTGNPHRQQEVPTGPQDQYMNSHRQHEGSIAPRMQRDLYVNPQRQQSMTGISQGMQYSMGTDFVGTSNYMQDMAEGNQQFHAQAHPTQYENQASVRYNCSQSSEPGFHN